MMQQWTRKSLLVGAIAASLSLAACGDNRNDAATSRTGSTSPSSTAATTDRVTADASAAANRAGNTTERAGDKAAATADKVAANASDAATTAKVKSRLMAEPGIDSLQIDVDTNNGRVTLTGQVDTPAHRARAKELAGSVEGVTGVVDRMAVKG
jgi:hyperosmotically inducible periplasmic protein